ncbi:MAG: hypothetical protein ACJ749_02535 [Flavisolibacter sp.]
MKEIKLDKLITYGAPLLILFGVTRLHAYYSSFGVTIIPFLDFTEMATAFLDTSLGLILFSALLFMIVFSEDSYSFYFEGGWKSGTKISNALIIVSAISFVIITTPFFEGEMGRYAFVAFATVVCAIFFIRSIKSLPVELRPVANYFFAAVAGCWFCYNAGVRQHFEVSKLKTKIGTNVLFNDSTRFVSDSFNYVIGNTRNYIFIYHEKQKVSNVYPLSSVKSMDMSAK